MLQLQHPPHCSPGPCEYALKLPLASQEDFEAARVQKHTFHLSAGDNRAHRGTNPPLLLPVEIDMSHTKRARPQPMDDHRIVILGVA